MGELQGHRESGHRGKGLKLPHDNGTLLIRVLAILTVTCGLTALFASSSVHLESVLRLLGVAGAGTLALLAKSLSDFSQTGPRIRKELLTHYRRYTLYALARLSA